MITNPIKEFYVKLTGNIQVQRGLNDTKYLKKAIYENKPLKVFNIDTNEDCMMKVSVKLEFEGEEYERWLFDEEYVEYKETEIKELLNKGIRITRDGFKYKYIYKRDDKILTDGNCVYGITLEDLDSVWYEYKKTKFKKYNDIKPNDFYYYIGSGNGIHGTICAGLIQDICRKNSMNCYPDKKIARLMQIKLDLIRKIETFAYLNNDWNNCDVPYCIYYALDKNDEYECVVVECDEGENICATQFSSREIAEKCLEIYDEDFKSYLLRKKNFGGK